MENKMTKINNLFVLMALYILAIGIFTSNSLSAISHIFFLISGVWSFRRYLKTNNLAGLPTSLYFLILLFIVYILSLLFNLPITEKFWPTMFKTRYFLIAWLSFFSIHELISEHRDLWEKHQKNILRVFIWSSIIATFVGLVALFFGYNYLRMKEACHSSRACGLYGMYMTYGYAMALLSPLSFVLLLKSTSHFFPATLFERIIFFLSSLLGLFFSYARGAWLGFFAAIFFFFQKNLKITFLIILMLVGALAISYRYSTGVQFMVHRRAESDHDRKAFSLAALYAFKENPVWGLGFRNFESQSGAIKEKYKLGAIHFKGHAHSNFLEHLASTGIVGLFVFCFWIITWWRESLSDPLSKKIIIPFISSLIVSGLFQYTLGDGENLYFILIIYILSTVYIYEQRKIKN